MNKQDLVKDLLDSDFEGLCEAIVNGLGFNSSKEYAVAELDKTFIDTLIRESTDKLFKSEESWLIGFSRKDDGLLSVQDVIYSIKESGVENVLFVIFNSVSEKQQQILHDELRKASINCALFFDDLANTLVYDYGLDYINEEISSSGLSIKKLREVIVKESQDATWRTQFQTLSTIAPTKITSTQGRDEADLFRAMSKTGSFLLLGDPGGGKTTSLKVLAEELAEQGGRTPIFMPLNQYSGNLLVDIGKQVGSSVDTFSAGAIKVLLDSGGFTIILDGLNEVHPANMQRKIRREIDKFTNPNITTSRSQWIVSGRKFDYETQRKLVGLEHLDKNTWEIQPLSPDLIYEFLKDGLDSNEHNALTVYRELDSGVMEICANPLMLNMFFAVYKEKNIVATGKGKLYGQFIDLLLRWGDEKKNDNMLKTLSLQYGDLVNKKKYLDIVFSVLMDLSTKMITISLPWERVMDSFITSLNSVKKPKKVATTILHDLIGRGMLKLQGRYISFSHHTFLEYFQALNLKGVPVDIIIPSSGVDGEKREQVVFLAGIVDGLGNLLISKAMKQDIDLSYDIYRNSKSPIAEKYLLELAKHMESVA